MYILEQRCVAKYSDHISSYSERLTYAEDVEGKLFANFFAPFHASADGHFAILTQNDDLNGLICSKSFCSLSLIPGKHAKDPVRKTFDTNFCWTHEENFFSINSIVSEIPACSWPIIEG